MRRKTPHDFYAKESKINLPTWHIYKLEMRQKQHDFYDKGAINKNTVTLGTLRSQSSMIFCEQRSGNKKGE